jgi:hypothetical protein
VRISRPLAGTAVAAGALAGGLTLGLTAAGAATSGTHPSASHTSADTSASHTSTGRSAVAARPRAVTAVSSSPSPKTKHKCANMPGGSRPSASRGNSPAPAS